MEPRRTINATPLPAHVLQYLHREPPRHSGPNVGLVLAIIFGAAITGGGSFFLGTSIRDGMRGEAEVKSAQTEAEKPAQSALKRPDELAEPEAKPTATSPEEKAKEVDRSYSNETYGVAFTLPDGSTANEVEESDTGLLFGDHFSLTVTDQPAEPTCGDDCSQLSVKKRNIGTQEVTDITRNRTIQGKERREGEVRFQKDGTSYILGYDPERSFPDDELANVSLKLFDDKQLAFLNDIAKSFSFSDGVTPTSTPVPAPAAAEGGDEATDEAEL
jgi:hypothetical protein